VDRSNAIFSTDPGITPVQLVVCPGVHTPALTEQFLAAVLGQQSLRRPAIVLPAEQYPPWSGWHGFQFVYDRLSICNPKHTWQISLVWIGFSAGVMGAIAAAHLWQWLGGRVIALIALDGWGVPLLAPFPIHRFSHDAFTHHTSSWISTKALGFYADPAVTHLDLWRSPRTAIGWQCSGEGSQPVTRAIAADLLIELLQHYKVI
jgi:hypothetical protein